jgi:hypothetical protein
MGVVVPSEFNCKSGEGYGLLLALRYIMPEVAGNFDLSVTAQAVRTGQAIGIRLDPTNSPVPPDASPADVKVPVRLLPVQDVKSVLITDTTGLIRCLTFRTCH